MRLASGGLKLKSWLSHRPVIVFGVIALLGLTIIISISPSFQDCFREHKHDPEYKALQEGIGYLRRMARLRLNRACAGDFVDKNDKAINALIAFFTFLLWVFYPPALDHSTRPIARHEGIRSSCPTGSNCRACSSSDSKTYSCLGSEAMDHSGCKNCWSDGIWTKRS